MLSLDDSNEARAKMPCGHVISTESMTAFLRSLVTSRKFSIICPSEKTTGAPCEAYWPYELCRQVAVLSKAEMEEFESGFEQNYFFF